MKIILNQRGGRILRRRGWVFMDVLGGILIVSVLAVILGKAAGMRNRVVQHLSDSRSADRLAESTLTSMQGGLGFAGGKDVTIRQLESGGKMAGLKWVEVTATVNHRQVSVVGLVPSSAAMDGVGGKP